MYKVSKKYKESMKSSLRERGFIMLTFGLINQEAQAKAKVQNGDYTYYSNKDNVFLERNEIVTYATLEENFCKVDGSMLFLPKNNNTNFVDTGITSNKLLTDAKFEILINLNIIAIDFKGLTLEFGDNYPVDFDIVSSKGQVVAIRNNNQSTFITEEVLFNTTSIRLVFHKMKYAQNRVRLYSIKFGYGLTYYNDNILDSKLESYVSPISADLPQIDFSVQFKNYDHYFNVDNPKSAINYLETGQEMDIMYGYQLPDSEEIEWLQGAHLLCSDWESNDTTATIRCQDVFRNLDTEFVKGKYHSQGITYYNLAIEVLQEAGIKHYYIDPRLKELKTNNPVPRVEIKQALQIIANACRCVIYQDRFGKLCIKSNFVPNMSASSNDETTFSKVSNVLNESVKDEYATLSTNYITTDGSMFFLPKNGLSSINTAYVSDSVSNDNALFNINPYIEIKLEAIRSYYGVKLTFGNTLPAEIIIKTYKLNSLVQTLKVNTDIDKITTIVNIFDDFDLMRIEFSKTQHPQSRVVVNRVELNDVTDFVMTKQDMMSSVKAIKQESVKEVIVPCYVYQENAKEDNLVSEEVNMKINQIETYFMQNASYGYRITLDEVATQNVEIVAQGNFFITLKFKVSGLHRLEIYGHRYQIIEKYASKQITARGKTIRWENPLISDMNMAQELANWLAEYYEASIEYEYDTRGNPEIDANDIVLQENEFIANIKVNVYRCVLRFKQAFSGKVWTRRLGGQNVVRTKNKLG